MSKSTSTSVSNVTREDIEKKLRELDEIVDDATNSAADIARIAIGVGVVVLVGIAFFSGRRRALRKRTIVSFIKTK